MKILYLMLIFLVLILEPAEAIITAKMYLSSEFSTVKVGDNILFEIRLVDLEGDNLRDVEVHYSLLDNQGNRINYGIQTVAIQTQTSITASLNIPPAIEEGNYKILVEIYEAVGGGGVIVKTSQDFFVSGLTFWEKIQTKKTYATIVGGLTLGFILLIIFMNIYNIKLLKKNTTLLRKNRTSLNNLIRK